MEVFAVLNDLADSNSVSQQHLFQLTDIFNNEPNQFIQALEQGYLKIIKNFSTVHKIHRRLFEQLTERFFSQAVKTWNEQQANPAQKTRKSATQDTYRGLLFHFMSFFQEGLESTQFNIRISCGRFLFMILKCIPIDTLNALVDDKLAFELLNSTVGLFRNSRIQKTSKTQKGLAVKLGSYLQHISQLERKTPRVKQAIIALKSEMVRTICEEEKKDLRLDALTNTELNEVTLPFIIIRIRDVDVNVRLQVFRKLIRNKMTLDMLQTSDLYQVIYDGLRNTSPEVVKYCENFIMATFHIYNKYDDMEEEGKHKSNRKSMHPEILPRISYTMKKLLNLFQVENTLVFPLLYQAIMDAFVVLIKQVDPMQLSVYAQDILSNRLPNGQVSGSELSFIKVLCKMTIDQETKLELSSDVTVCVDHNHPDGLQMASILGNNFDILTMYEMIQLCQCQINCDLIGQAKMADVVKQILCARFNAQSPRPRGKFNEIYEEVNEDQLESRWFAQHHFEQPIIRHYFDLIQPLVVLLKTLTKDQETLIASLLEIVAKIRSNSPIEQKIQIEQQLNAHEEQFKELAAQQEVNNKKKRSNQSLLQVNDTLLAKTQQTINELQAQLKQINQEIENSDIHALYILDSLFNQIDITEIQESLINKLKYLVKEIGDKYLSEDMNMAKKLAFRCMGYIPLFGLDHGGSIIAALAQILDSKQDQNPTDDVIVVTALRSILDTLLMYDGDQSWVSGTETFTKVRIMNIILNFAVKNKGMTQAIALEGLCKLITHEKVHNPSSWIAILLFLWFDNSLRTNHLPLQIVTSFFKLYITSSLSYLQNFERGLEIYFSITCYLHSNEGLKFNEKYLTTDQSTDQFMTQCAQVGMKMMSYRNLKAQPSMIEFAKHMQLVSWNKNDYYLGPQERLLFVLQKLVVVHNNLVLKQGLQAQFKNADFLEVYEIDDVPDKIRVSPKLFEIMSEITRELIEKYEKHNLDTKQEKAFLKAVEEDASKQRTQDAVQIRDKLDDEFDAFKREASQLVHELKKNNIIIDATKKEGIIFSNQYDNKSPMRKYQREVKRKEDDKLIKMNNDRYEIHAYQEQLRVLEQNYKQSKQDIINRLQRRLKEEEEEMHNRIAYRLRG